MTIPAVANIIVMSITHTENSGIGVGVGEGVGRVTLRLLPKSNV